MIRVRKIVLLLLVFLTILITGCSSSKDLAGPEEIYEVKNESLSIDDYFPFLENTVFEYAGFGSEFAEKSSYFEYINGNRAQIKIINPGTNLLMIIENKGGLIKEIYSEGEFYHIENLLNIDAKGENILLKEPLEVGNVWETIDGAKREITGVNVDIETPYGVLNAIEVSTFRKDAMDLDYYAPGLGLVASISRDKDIEVKSLLKSVNYKARKIAIEKYYPIDIDSDLVYVNGEINFETNASIESLIEDILKNPNNEMLIPVISPKTKLNSIQLDRNNWKLRADFSPELISDMNYGGSMESKVLMSIVNTLGRFYDVDGITITIDGRAYESGHFYFKEDEVLEVNTEGMNEFRD